LYCSYLFVFFFQAEDGIRDFHVTGVQTCALPISLTLMAPTHDFPTKAELKQKHENNKLEKRLLRETGRAIADFNMIEDGDKVMRSEERRVGKECRYRGWRYG